MQFPIFPKQLKVSKQFQTANQKIKPTRSSANLLRRSSAKMQNCQKKKLKTEQSGEIKSENDKKLENRVGNCSNILIFAGQIRVAGKHK